MPIEEIMYLSSERDIELIEMTIFSHWDDWSPIIVKMSAPTRDF